MFKIVICEDNPKSLEKFALIINKILIKENIDGQVVHASTNAESVLSFLETNDANIFFIDIDLKSKENGYHLAEVIREKDKLAYIIFITGHFEYALQAFKVKAFDFLPKPVVEEVLEQCILRIYNDFSAINKLYENTSVKKERYIELKAENSLWRLRTSEIIFIEKQRFKVVVHLKDRSISFYGSLEAFIRNLEEESFIRCHKSFIVNISYIHKINFKEKTIYFETGHKCFIGDKYKNTLNSRICC